MWCGVCRSDTPFFNADFMLGGDSWYAEVLDI